MIIEDGVYFLHPDGSGWEAVKFQDGQLLAATEESMATTHRAANDWWAGIEPGYDDVVVPDDLAREIVLIVEGKDSDPASYVVTRPR